VNRKQTTEKMYTRLTRQFFTEVHLVATKLVPLWRYTHLMDHELIDYQESNPQRVLHIHSQDGILQATSFTRVVLHDPRGVSTIPLTNPPLEPRTISTRASTESQATKPSRRWQPPRVTSTTSLQHDHLVPLDAIPTMQRTRIALSLDPMNTIKHE
jgi:hypothetical protein